MSCIASPLLPSPSIPAHGCRASKIALHILSCSIFSFHLFLCLFAFIFLSQLF
jgi:hypothetical protein